MAPRRNSLLRRAGEGGRRLPARRPSGRATPSRSTTPEEPAAAKIWLAAKARHPEAFKNRMAEARTSAAAQISVERADLDARLAAAAAFEAWLSDERRGQAKGAMPDPIPLVERTETADETDLRNQLASLSAALTRAKAREEELKASKVDVARLNEQLSAGSSETQRLRDDAGARIPVGQRVASNALRRGFVPCCLTMI